MRSLAKKTPTDHGMETFAENVESLMQTHDDNAAPGVFEKVKDMIENMIASKKKEAASEQTKKAYCDEEQSKTKAKLEELSSKKDTLGAKVDKKTSESETLKREALTLQKELGELSELQVGDGWATTGGRGHNLTAWGFNQNVTYINLQHVRNDIYTHIL